MNRFIKNVALLGAIFFLVAVTGARVMASEAALRNVNGDEEILVAKNVVSESALWCGGSDVLVYQVKYGDLYYYDTVANKSVRIDGEYKVPLFCTPDGAWLVYLDRESYRYDQGKVDEGLILDAWRYEFKTGQKQKFLVMHERCDTTIDGALFSSTGKVRLRVADRPVEAIEMPEPRWEVEWQERCRVLAWSKDSSLGFCDEMVAEVFVPQRKTIEIEHGFDSAIPRLVDMQGRLYIGVHGRGTYRTRVERCEVDLDEKKAACTPMLGGDDDLWYDRIFNVTFDGETIVYTSGSYGDVEHGDTCVRKKRIGDKQGQCITKPVTGFYAAFFIALSPDDKRAVFEISLDEGEGDGLFKVFDLYMVNLR